MLRTKLLSLRGRMILLALLLMVILPVGVFAQRRWRTHRSHIVIYQPSSYLVYRRPAYAYRTYSYGYPQSYYSTYYSNGYGYTQPYYASPYYGYRYSQPYIGNGYSYGPTYYYQNYRPRRHNRFRLGIVLR